MSYCRWSSDNFQCDIYAYYSVGDFWQIYVASNRIVGEPPKSDWGLIMKDANDESRTKFIEQEKVRSQWMENCEREPIGLKYDGDSFECGTPQEFYDTMIELKNVGYRFPDYVLEEIKFEIEKVNKQNNIVYG